MKSIRLIALLVTSQLRLRPARALITIIGVMASTCAVVWIVSGFDALVSQFDENSQKYLGRYDILVVPQAPPGGVAEVSPSMLASLEADPGVMELNAVSQARVSVTRVRQEGDEEEKASALGLLIGSRPPVNGAPPLDPTLVGTDATEPPYELVAGEWLSDEDAATSCVMSADSAKSMGVAPGDQVLITSLANQKQLTVVGLVEQAQDTPSLGGGRGGRGGRGRGGRGRGASRRGNGAKSGDKSGAGRGRGARGAGGPRGSGPREDSRRGSSDEVAQDDDNGETGDKQSNQLGIPGGMTSGAATNAVYVRSTIADEVNGRSLKPNVLQIAFRDGVTTEQFREVWEKRFESSQPQLKIIDFDAVRQGMETSRSVGSQRSQAWAATGLASVAAVFIILCTLSIGVGERAREFAMLRAIAFTRSQVAAVVTAESVLLALIGWLAGLLAGWFLILAGSRMLPGMFQNGAALGYGCITLSGLTVVAGAFGAAIIPAWRAMSIRPVAAMSQKRKPPSFRFWTIVGLFGVALIVSAPLTVFVLPLSDSIRSWCYATVTYPALFLGMALITPALVLAMDRWVAPVVLKAFRLNPRLGKTQLSSNLWRTIGATLALSIGLGLYASTQTWGYSMLQPFLPGDWLPDMLVAFHPVGLDDEGELLVRDVNGVQQDGALPLAIEQAKFDWNDQESPERVRYDNAVLFGLDSHRAIGSDNPFLDLDFVSGDRQTIAEQLKTGKTCVISQDFQMTSGLKVGDQLSFTPPNAPQERVSYKIVGVVSLPGWHWITKFSGVRRHFVRTATMVFVDRQAVSRDFHLPRTEFFWLNLEKGVSLSQVETDLQAIAERHAGETFQGDGVGEVTAYRPFARATATENVRQAIRLRADGMIMGMSYLPLVTLVIMSLAVANAVIASVRARTWEFGVLRSIGVERFQLVRFIVAETLLIGMTACVLSLIFGIVAGWCGVGMAQYGGWFAGPPTFLIPWLHLLIGFALTVGLCFVAAIWPAWRIGRSEPLRLLQAGRGAS